ncbi:hypothetical protein [Kamptonema sp. PCC 6506]|uniref:hypothetical protein n=1 Tax=Kamptonema sp. PCC 6506 TaxID=272129 RepID=UPI000697A047
MLKSIRRCNEVVVKVQRPGLRKLFEIDLLKLGGFLQRTFKTIPNGVSRLPGLAWEFMRSVVGFCGRSSNKLSNKRRNAESVSLLLFEQANGD